jgi:hypothetical protein
MQRRSGVYPSHAQCPHVAPWYCWLMLAALCLLPGCSCSSADDPNNPTATTTDPAQQTPEEKAAAEKKALAEKRAEEERLKKLPFERVDLSVLPQFNPELPKVPDKNSAKNKKPTPAEEAAIAAANIDLVKPRHWYAVRERRKANHQDYPGGMIHAELQASGGTASLEDTPYSLSVERDLGLARDVVKFPEYRVYIPPTSRTLNTTLRDRQSGDEYQTENFPFSRMLPNSYLWVMITPDKAKFERWKRLDTFRAPATGGLKYDYQLIIPYQNASKNTISLPSNLINWSSTAIAVWDNTDPGLLDSQQQTALLDWVHWGGQLIINGPTSLDQLKGSWLDSSPEKSYLPGQNWAARSLDKDDFAPFINYWSARDQAGKLAPGLYSLQVNKPWDGLSWTPAENAKPVPNTNELVWSRQFGRGRIVVTLFNLKQKEFTDWLGLDSFVNSALAGRSARFFSDEGANYDLSVPYRVSFAPALDYQHEVLLPLHNSKLRYLTRDWHDEGVPSALLKESNQRTSGIPQGNPFPRNVNPYGYNTLEEEPENTVDYTAIRTAGAWNDANPLADAVRTSLGEASGIKIPNAKFVGAMLAIYLGVLVVLNYGIFRIIGRVEYAWFAAPVIAVIGSLAVIKLAQLDIGFARSQTEIAIIECHQGYSRAHLTRYTGLYSSLSTTYEIKFADNSSVALPFAGSSTVTSSKRVTPVVLKQSDNETILSGFQVMSNSSSMIHSEQLLSLKGPFSYQRDTKQQTQFVNNSEYDLQGLVLFRKFNDQLQYVVIGELLSGKQHAVSWPEKTLLKFDDLLKNEWVDYANAIVENEADTPKDKTKIPLEPVLKQLGLDKTFRAGEVRAIGFIPKQLPGITVAPSAAQSDRSMTIVVCHCQLPEEWLAVRDHNWKPKVDNQSRSILDDDDVMTEETP